MPRTGRPPQIESERYWKRVDRRAPEECWPWIGTRYPNGYGLFHRGGRDGHNVAAHRLSYELTYGPIKEKMKICHRCDNPSCCNPNHLFKGSQGDNISDAISKGRKLGTSQGGSCGGQFKFTEAEKGTIHKMLKLGTSIYDIAIGCHKSPASIERFKQFLSRRGEI